MMSNVRFDGRLPSEFVSGCSRLRVTDVTKYMVVQWQILSTHNRFANTNILLGVVSRFYPYCDNFKEMKSYASFAKALL